LHHPSNMKRKRLLLFAITSLCATWGTVAAYQRISSRAAAASNPALPAPPPTAASKATFSFRAAMEAALTLAVVEQRAAVVACFEHPELIANLEDADWILGLYLADVRAGYPRVRKDDWLGYLTKLVRRNPQVAAEFLLRKDRLIGTGADDDARCLMSVWAGLNPLEVIAWAATGKDQGEWARRNGQALAEAWSVTDLHGLLDYVSAGGSEPSEWVTVDALAKQRGAQALDEWLEAEQNADSKLPTGMRRQLVNKIAEHKLKVIGPAETAAWVGQRTNKDELFAGVGSVAPGYARQQPERAISWVEGFSSIPGFPSRTGEVTMVEFATRDLAGAGEWLNAHLNSPIVSAYIWAYAVQAALEDPEAANAWVAKLPQDGGWGTQSPRPPGTPQPFPGLSEMVEGGRTPKTLAMNIKAAGRAGQIFRDSRTPLPPWEGERPHFLRYDPILIKTSPNAEPILQMMIHPEGACHMIVTDSWPGPLATYIQGANGSLIYEQPKSQATN
jgi:hypothetical protein